MQINLKQKRRRHFKKEHIDFIVETALKRFISSTKILKQLKNQFENIKVSKSKIIRVLTENKFKFRKPKHIQFLTRAQKYNRYYFSMYMLKYNLNIFKNILFSDECRFCRSPDNRCRWLRSYDFRESNSARYSKYTFGMMEWRAIDMCFKSQRLFPKSKIDGIAYRKLLDNSQIFDDVDKF